MFARYYNSATGRFLSPDWSAKEEPVPYAKLDNPQSLNLYSYVGNNPVGRADADGHCYPLCTALIGGAIGAGINVGITYFTNPNATARDYAGAAASGFITGAVAGATGGLGLGAAVAANASAGVIGGVAERAITGEHNTAKQEIVNVVKDAAIGAAGPLLSAAGGKVAAAINGKDAQALGEAAEGAHLGERHSASLKKQAAAAAAFEEAGSKVGDGAGHVLDGANRTKGNLDKDKDKQ